MPTVLRWHGFRFYFFSNEGVEPPHIHIDKDGNSAKFWLAPVSLAKNYGFSDNELNELVKKLKDETPVFLDAWHEYFGE